MVTSLFVPFSPPHIKQFEKVIIRPIKTLKEILNRGMGYKKEQQRGEYGHVWK
jgi:hypothetical protein